MLPRLFNAEIVGGMHPRYIHWGISRLMGFGLLMIPLDGNPGNPQFNEHILIVVWSGMIDLESSHSREDHPQIGVDGAYLSSVTDDLTL